jgi:superfamily I DNA/RNA helicase
LFVTFTRTAARDLKNKIAELETPLAGAIHASTLHSLCLTILNQDQALRATARVPRILLKYEQECLLHDLEGHGFKTMREKRERLAAFEAAWARLDSQSPAAWSVDPADQEFQRQLDAWLRFHRGLLLGELVPLTLAFLRDEPTARAVWEYKNVLVDEYQDLNRVEQVLIDLLAGQDPSITVMGDDDQSIYTTLRNAFPEGIVQFPCRHKGARAETLQKSLRCPPNIVAMANAFLANPASERLTDRTLNPDQTRPDAEVHIVRWKTLDTEVKGLPRFIKWYSNAHEIGWGDVIVISPRRQIGYRIRDGLRKLGVEAQSFFFEEALDSELSRDHFTLLSLLVNRQDRVALRYWLGSPTQRPASYRKVRDWCSGNSQSLWEAMRKLSSGEISLPGTAELVHRFLELEERLKALDGLTGQDLLDSWLAGHSSEDAEDDLADLRAMAQRACQAEQDIGPSLLREKLLEEITQPELPSAADCVRIMSPHKSKGLTAKLVVITGLSDGLIPFVKSGLPPQEHNRHMQEQRRLFFVALTRATKCLVFSSSKLVREGDALDMNLALPSYDKGKHWRLSAPSPFLSQLGKGGPHQTVDGNQWLANFGL